VHRFYVNRRGQGLGPLGLDRLHQHYGRHQGKNHEARASTPYSDGNLRLPPTVKCPLAISCPPTVYLASHNWSAKPTRGRMVWIFSTPSHQGEEKGGLIPRIQLGIHLGTTWSFFSEHYAPFCVKYRNDVFDASFHGHIPPPRAQHAINALVDISWPLPEFCVLQLNLIPSECTLPCVDPHPLTFTHVHLQATPFTRRPCPRL